MTTWGETIQSKWIKKDNITRPFKLTIREVVPVVVMDEKTREEKPVLYFTETEKGLPLNITNITTMETLFGTDITACVGKQIEIFIDPTVSMKGMGVTGGLRLRAPNTVQSDPPPTAQAVPASVTPPQPAATVPGPPLEPRSRMAGQRQEQTPVLEDDIPF